MNIICLEEEAFHAPIDKVVLRLKEQTKAVEEKWISGEEAMYKMRITSRTTLKKMRDEGSTKYTQPEKKIILYDTDSTDDYLNKHSKDTF